LHVSDQPGEDEFDDFVLHVDGYLCEVKDSLIRDGLHVLGGAPVGEARVNLVLAILRANQVWGGTHGALPGLRTALSVHSGLSEVDERESLARKLVAGCDALDWAPDKVPAVVAEVLGTPVRQIVEVLGFAASEVVPRLAATTDEIAAVLHALDGGYVAAGPS